MMSDGSPCGDFGLSQLQETELVNTVASTLGTSLEASRIALEASQYDIGDAIHMLTHAQWIAPAAVSHQSRAASKNDLAELVMKVCDVDMETASAVLKVSGNDPEEAIDMLTKGEFNPNAMASTLSVNTTSCCDHLPGLPEDLSSPPTCPVAIRKPFVKGQYACYLDTGEMVRVVSVLSTTDKSGAQYDSTLQTLTIVPVRATLRSVTDRRNSKCWTRETCDAR
jgi:NACalpha-BTF3-like transcription factor